MRSLSFLVTRSISSWVDLDVLAISSISRLTLSKDTVRTSWGRSHLFRALHYDKHRNLEEKTEVMKNRRHRRKAGRGSLWRRFAASRGCTRMAARAWCSDDGDVGDDAR